jgi:hypothetical protein
MGKQIKRVAKNTAKNGLSKRHGNKGRRFTVGREAFAKISAIEGLNLSGEMWQDFRKFDREGVPHEKRRRAIVSKYAGKV